MDAVRIRVDNATSQGGSLPQNILLIQDDPADAQAVRDALLSSNDGPFQVDWVRNRAEGLNRLALTGKQMGRPSHMGRHSHGIAAVLVDLYLPDSRGIETFDRLFQAAPQIPILVLIGAGDEAIARLAVQRGAQDFLLKDRLDNYWLPKALRSMVERAANGEALYEEKERAEVTLNSIGDAVMSTDEWGNVTYLNAVAEQLTGWSRAEAAGRALGEVFHIVDAVTREAVADPMALALRENKTVGLTPNSLLIRRDGVEAAIEDSAAPIHDRRGQVTGAVMVFHDVSTARAQSLRMSYLAQHDGLTDLPNRILFNDRLTQAMSLAQRRQKKLALLFLDLDHFKHINDSLGHAIGDRLLQSVAKRLLDCVRSSDTVSRQGGDEFVILLSQVMHAEDAGISAEKILSALNQPHHIGEHAIFATASIGIVTYPDDASDAETLLKNADFAMYQAKDYGRNNYQFFKSDLNVTALERQAVEHGLRHAVERDELVLHYQPQINLATGAIAGVEALLRWRHPLRGLLHPASFISVAEESGWIVPIGRWALREGCRQADGLAGRGAAADAHRRQCLCGGIAGQGFRRRRARRLAGYAFGPALSRAGVDRNLPDARFDLDRDRARGAEGHGRAARARRLRHGVFESVLYEALPHRYLEDRPVVRAQFDDRRRRRQHRERGDPHGQQPAHAGRGRGG